MVNHCAVGGCNNRHGRDTSSRRSFLVFHAVPRDAKRRKAWDKRVNRADHDIRRFSFTINDSVKREDYLKAHLTPKKWRYLAYKSFVNLISSQDLDRKVRYVLPSPIMCCVSDPGKVSKHRWIKIHGFYLYRN